MSEYVMELRKYVVPEIIVGRDARLLIGRYIQHFTSKKPMIVTDDTVSRQVWFDQIMQEISRHSSGYVLFRDVTPNPKDTEVMEGAEIFSREKCDLIIAIGGGSPMDCAKCISIVSTNGGNILDYEGVDEIDLPGPPLICIPSTAGTSADVSQFAIVLDTEAHIKKAIISKKVVPDLALIDPIPLTTMDRELTACTGMDALTHAIEAYVSSAHSSLTDMHALEAIGLIAQSIENAAADSRSLEDLFKMMLGSIQAGIAFSNASLGAVHAMAHSIGGLLDLPHGECNSILLEHIVSVNFDAEPEKYRTIAEKMGIPQENLSDAEVQERLNSKISALRASLGIQSKIMIHHSDCGEIIRKLTEGAMADPCMVTNPKKLTIAEVQDIYGKIIQCRPQD